MWRKEQSKRSNVKKRTLKMKQYEERVVNIKKRGQNEVIWRKEQSKWSNMKKRGQNEVMWRTE